MKKIYFFALAFISTISLGQTTLYTQDFETNLTGYSHNPSQTPISDPGDQYFNRAEPSDPDIYEGAVGPYTNVTGSWLFVGSNPNTINSGNPGVLSLGSGISVSGFSDLELSIDFGAVPSDWDDSDNLSVEYSWDNSNWSQLYSFGHSSGFNQPISLVGNATGGANTANGTTLTYALQTITSSNFTGTGSTLYLRVVCDAGANYEAFGMDNVILTGLAAGPTIVANPNTLTGFTQFVGTPSAEQSFDVSGTNLTNDIVLNVTTGDYEISETSGGTFGNTITLTQSGGVVSATTIYVRLNGTTASSPANGDITLTSTGATNQTVTLEGEILPPDPTVFATPLALSGFSHFVGTPSAEQTIDVSGANLTADVTVSAPTNYEVSTTSGSGFGTSVTLTQSGGTLASTPVYVRLNGASANYSQVGNIDVTSTNATTVQVALDGETLDYTPYDIGEVTANDANLSPDSLNVYVSLKGIVHCIDFEDGPGYSFTIIDDANDGINVFNFNDVNGYSSTEGDSITVKGQIGFFNGLTQIFAEEIILETQGNPIQTPTIVTDLDETTESQYVTMENLTFVNPQTNWSTGNVDVTDGNNTFVLRIESASPLVGTAAPNGPFDVTGIGGQYDNSGAPYDAGYQLYPCSVNPLCNVDVTTATANAIITANATGAGVSYQWLDCDNNDLPIPNEMGQTFTPTTSGNYAVEITDGACVDTSNCVNVQVCNVDVTTTTTDLTIEANATGLTYQWLDCNNNDEEIVGEDGQSFTATSNGNYAVIVTDGVCADTSECVAINTIGVDKEELSLSVYPNPVQNQLNVVSKGAAIVEVKVISVTGKEISFVKSNEHVLIMNTANWTTGVYFVEVKTNSGSKIVKVIK